MGMVYGINEPGEEPADTVAREVKEETGVDVIVTDLVSVKSSHKVLTYANGDNTMYMNTCLYAGRIQMAIPNRS